MSKPHTPTQPDPGRSRRVLRRATVATTTLAVLGGALLASQSIHASTPRALARGAMPRPVEALAPPVGTTWIVGVVSDQAAHGQDNVNVEAWPDDPTATEPVASALTYGGPRFNLLSGHGFFRLEVPSDQAYRIVFSAVGAKEDGDPFRRQWYGHRRPIVARSAAVGTGRVRNLGQIALARQGKVNATAKAKALHKRIAVGSRGKVQVKVSSRFVTHVRGKVVVRVGRHQKSARLTTRDHGKVAVRLPKLHHAGSYRVVARFTGTNTVRSAKAKPVTIKVVRK